jgi:DNA repair protein RecN (Recombination protein N)
MISYLEISNFVLVKNLKLHFSSGLQVLTGETGAGKSVIVGAIDLIFGGQAHSGLVLDESKPAYLEIGIENIRNNKQLIKLLKKYEIDTAEGEIFFSREIKNNKRSRSFINGRRVARDIIEEFREVLLDFHSQRDQQKLFQSRYQLEILDRYAKLIPQRNDFQKQYKNLEIKLQKLRKMQQQEAENKEKMQLYNYQIEEIEAAELKLDEDKQIQSELEILDNAESILNNSAQMENEIYEKENSIYEILSRFASILERYHQENTTRAASLLQDSLANLDDAVAEIRELQNIVDLDSSQKEKLEARLDAINLLKNKYQKNIPEILQYYQKIKQNLANFKSETKQIERLQATIKQDFIRLSKIADLLNQTRKKAAVNLEKLIEKNIQKLAIPDARLNIQFDKINKDEKKLSSMAVYSEYGYDKIDFYFSANKGITPQPLENAASGGEISRVLLAIKKILSENLEPRIIIFDEIDTGIGGKTSKLLGQFISQIASSHQVLCITHLAPIASYANRHFSIRKQSSAKLAEIIVKILSENERKDEIARMISGSNTKLALKYAEEILKKGEINDNG